MSAVKGSGKRKKSNRETVRSEKNMGIEDSLPSHLKEIMLALRVIKAKKESHQKTEHIINSVASEIQSMTEDVRSKSENERGALLKAISESAEECDNALTKVESKSQASYDRFRKKRTRYLQDFKDILSDHEEKKKNFFLQHEQQRKKEESRFMELKEACRHKIANAEEVLEKKQQYDKELSVLRESLVSLLESQDNKDISALFKSLISFFDDVLRHDD